MDKRIRKYVLYKAKTLGERKQELKSLYAKRKEVLDSTGGMQLDGTPTGKGKVGNPTEQKAFKLIEIDRRIKKLEEEIGVFTRFEAEVTGIQKEIYIETIKKNCINLTAKAELMGMGRRQLIERRAKILRHLAQELGEYLEKEK